MNMLTNLAWIIADLYEEIGRRNPVFQPELRLGGEYTSIGLFFSIRIKAWLGKEEVQQCLHFILTGSTHVWCAKSAVSAPAFTPWNEWVNASNHDSEWRSEGIDQQITKLYFDLCDEVQREREAKVAPKDVEVMATLGRSHPFTWVNVKFRSVENYRYQLVDVTLAKGKYMVEENNA